MESLKGYGTDLILMHITPLVNILSIQAEGIQPRYALKNDGKIWFTTYQSVMWGFVHVSQKHALPTNLLAACVITIDQEHAYVKGFKHHGRNRWWAEHAVQPEDYLLLIDVLELLEVG